jgi:hypothetical protein
MYRDDEPRWTPSVFEFPEADHSQNPPTVIGVPRASSAGEILGWHSEGGSLDDTIREYCGLEISR